VPSATRPRSSYSSGGVPRLVYLERGLAWIGPPIDVRALFPVERLELLSVLRALDAAEWRRATACPGWSVHDIATHLVHDYLRRLSST
jgi:hypothetical protein